MSDRSSEETSSAPTDDGPVTLRWAVLVLWLESAALGVLAIVEIVMLVTAPPDRLDGALLLIGAVAAASVFLGMGGRAFVHRKPWPFSPTIALQLVGGLPVAFFMVTGDGASLATKIIGVAIGVVALSCVALLVAKPSRDALTLG